LKELDSNENITISLEGQDFTIDKSYVDVRIEAKEGFSVAMENGVFTILDTSLSPELIQEGLARELISKVQQMRKQHDFEMMDRIKIYVSADKDVQEAVDFHKDYIMKETLAREIVNSSQALEESDLNGHKTGISVERI
jgi:isoleucyl-tRNA synthetase